ncbi:6,7-dimethyl-8-ribityllumazine synthase [candidate division CSSED10-310 bacterium]|uniref:6,7-dimethyl-8-ribityllumazine synthase n=1 Tax=candidate division CSSED10-310 bacterium TaxID=2855610 RepID=A0ABV6YSP1_UNCC1
MPVFHEGHLDGSNLRVAIIISRFNDFITQKLLDGALDGLTRNGTSEKDIEVFWTPGSFEIPLIAKKVAALNKFDAIICLGTVIRGGTPHFNYIAAEVSKGIAHVTLDSGVPIIFGVLTTESIEQAIERAGTKHGNKGKDAALAAIEMVNLINNL